MNMFKEEFNSLVTNILGIDEKEITSDAKFIEDLGADSLDMVELFMGFENKFKVSIPQEDMELITTIREAEDYLKNRLNG